MVQRLLARQRFVLFAVGILVMAVTVVAQTGLGGGATIQGIVRSKQTPLPGAVVTAVDAAGSKTVTAVTEVNGQYILKVPGAGTYHVTVDMTLFSATSGDVEVTDVSKPVQKNFDLTLQSQAQRAAVRQNAPAGNRSAANGTARGGDATEPATAAAEEDPFADLNNNAALALLPGMTRDAATESVVQNGNVAAPAFGGAFDARQINLAGIPGNNPDLNNGAFGTPNATGGNGGNAGAAAGQQRGGAGGRGGGGGFGAALGGARGGRGGGGAGGRGGGGRGGGNGLALGGQRGRNANPINVNLTYTLNNSLFNAAPYSLKGNPV